MEYLDFVDTDYKPSSSDLICLYRVDPAPRISIQEAAGRIAAETSVGMPDKRLAGERPDIFGRMKGMMATAFEIKENFVKIAYPESMFETSNIPQILNCITTSAFGINSVINLRLHDVLWPKKIVTSFKGPQFGADGVRKLLEVKNRPMTVTVPIPKLGMKVEDYTKVIYLGWLGGIDLVREDSNLSSFDLKTFQERVSLSLKVRNKLEKHIGEKRGYIPNVTAETREMLRRTKYVYDRGGEFVMVDVSIVGWSALQTLREICEDLKIAIYAHHLLNPVLTKNPRNGISMLVAADVARIMGIDQLYLGSMIKGDKTPEHEVIMEEEMMRKFVAVGDSRLNDSMFGLKSVLPVVGGCTHPSYVPDIVKLFGNDVLIEFGENVYKHPDGTRDGAAAMRQAIEATVKGVPLKHYAKNHIELWESLKQ
jgi:ribulose-bisphosphate carboxylase large chain